MAKTKYQPAEMVTNALEALSRATATPEPAEPPVSNVSPVPEPVPVQIPVIAATPPSRAEEGSVALVKPISPALNPSRNTVYLYPDDISKIRKLIGYASLNHGIRANDSMIVRAALAGAEADVRFMHDLKNTELSDRRRTKL